MAPLVLATVALGRPAPAAAQEVHGEACAPGEGVTVVVDFTTLGDVRVACAPGEQASGFAALAAAGFTVGSEAGPGSVCTIDGSPAEGYPYCWATGGYWSYWKKDRGGTWGFSGSGPSGGPIAVDSVEGWSWAQGFSSAAPRADESTAPPVTTTTTTTTTSTTPVTSTSTSTTSPTAGPTRPAPTSSTAPGAVTTSTLAAGSSTTSDPGAQPPPARPAGGGRPATSGAGAADGRASTRPRAALARTGGPLERSAVAGAALLVAGGAAAASARRLRRPV